jgi:hypothetical protein
MTGPPPGAVRRVLALLLAAVGSGSACAEGPPEPVPVDPAEHEAAVAAFAAARVAELAAPDSWLSLIGLHWLEQGTRPPDSSPSWASARKVSRWCWTTG